MQGGRGGGGGSDSYWLRLLIIPLSPSLHLSLSFPCSRFAFITLQNSEEAQLVIKKLDGYRMDKTHILAVNLFDDVDRYTCMEDEYKEPEIEAFVEKEHLKSWLMDERGRDEWVMTRGDDTGIYWSNRTDEPIPIHNRQVNSNNKQGRELVGESSSSRMHGADPLNGGEGRHSIPCQYH